MRIVILLLIGFVLTSFAFSQRRRPGGPPLPLPGDRRLEPTPTSTRTPNATQSPSPLPEATATPPVVDRWHVQGHPYWEGKPYIEPHMVLFSVIPTIFKPDYELYIINKKTKLCLAIHDLNNQSDVQLSYCSADAEGERWSFSHIDTDLSNVSLQNESFWFEQIKSFYSGRCVDGYGNTREVGAKFQDYSCDKSKQNQQFLSWVRGTEGYFQLQVRHSGGCLEPDRDDREPNGTVRQYECRKEFVDPDLDYQLWDIRPRGEINFAGLRRYVPPPTPPSGGGSGGAGSRPPRTKVICRGQAIDAGWVITGIDQDYVNCRPAELGNRYLLTDLSSRPAGSYYVICANSPIPSGWRVQSSSPSNSACASQGSKTIIKN